MRAARTRWYVFGAQAVALHGHPRFSADLDVTVEVVGPLDAFVGRLVAGGFVPRVPEPAGFLARARVLPCMHAATGLPVDVVRSGPGLEEEFFERLDTKKLGRVRVPVLSVEDLIVTKALAGRAKDLDDVRALFELHRGSLDERRIERDLRALGAALGEDLLERLPREKSSARRARKR